jgi:hypothetical protein
MRGEILRIANIKHPMVNQAVEGAENTCKDFKMLVRDGQFSTTDQWESKCGSWTQISSDGMFDSGTKRLLEAWQMVVVYDVALQGRRYLLSSISEGCSNGWASGHKDVLLISDARLVGWGAVICVAQQWAGVLWFMQLKVAGPCIQGDGWGPMTGGWHSM